MCCTSSPDVTFFLTRRFTEGGQAISYWTIGLGCFSLLFRVIMMCVVFSLSLSFSLSHFIHRCGIGASLFFLFNLSHQQHFCTLIWDLLTLGDTESVSPTRDSPLSPSLFDYYCFLDDTYDDYQQVNVWFRG